MITSLYIASDIGAFRFRNNWCAIVSLLEECNGSPSRINVFELRESVGLEGFVTVLAFSMYTEFTLRS